MANKTIRNHPKFNGVFVSGPAGNWKLYTKNLIPGDQVYGERLYQFKKEEYRAWDPYRSKLAALLLNNPMINFLSDDLNCLYLGASSGTTISHLSDIAHKGTIYGVEFAPRSMRQLIQNTMKRKNIVPVLGDARYPYKFARSIFTNTDLIYQDVAQPNQAEIAIANADYYLKAEGIIIIAIKSQSINSVKSSEKVYKEEKEKFTEAGYKIVETVNIHRYAANHIALIIRKGKK
ncbi:MAG: fibrillarin-like rRNA/tRNA 2'-O-methyltransferase [Promethearchaeia archaeon]